MNNIKFFVPPFPHFIACGEDLYEPGVAHPRRKEIGVFDLLIVTGGSLWLGEEDQQWQVEAGQFLLLKPDSIHFPTKPCDTRTHFFWLHFSTTGEWGVASQSSRDIQDYQRAPFKPLQLFSLTLPKYGNLKAPVQFYNKIKEMVALEQQVSSNTRMQQQIMFQQILLEFVNRHEIGSNDAYRKVTEFAADYLKTNYKSVLTYEELGESLHFHPTYISRCMKKVYGCTPLEFLNLYRIEQAKQLLINTEWSIAQIAEEVGFTLAPYFTRCFQKIEGVPPRMFRKRYRF